MNVTGRLYRWSILLCVAVLLAACGEDDNAQFASASSAAAIPRVIDQLHTDAVFTVPGLGAGTEVVFDEIGMPHVYAPDRESALFVQGYLTARDRFWEMDAFRRVAEGRLSEIFGKLTLATDVQMRTVFTTRDGRRIEEAMWQLVQQTDPEITRLLQAYAGGVNAWLADLRAGRNGATLPPEYNLGVVIDLTADELADWRPQDTLAIARLQAWNLSDSMEAEIALAAAKAALPDAVFRDVFRSAPAAPDTVLPPTSAPQAAQRHAAAVLRDALALPPNIAEIAAGLNALRDANPLGAMRFDIGSNNWIVAPSLSANGHAMLANDPHLQLLNPPIWHMIELDVAGSSPERVTGVIFPGLPAVILGYNEFGAWGATTADYDVTDVYVETVTTPPDYPNSPRTVFFKGEQVPVLRIEEPFQVRKVGTMTEVIEVVPHHGPMVPDPNLKDSVVGLAATNMSFRWTGHEITNDPRFLLDLDQARNVGEFRDSLKNFATGAQNWIWADITGDIAYSTRALIPQRPPGTVPYLPMPGTGEAEWLTDAQGNTLWLPDDKIPQAVNPPEGFLSSANNDQIGTTLDNDPLNDPVYLAFAYNLGFREQRIHELLSNAANVRPAGAKISAADMSAYQYDHSNKEAAELLPFLFAAAQARPDLVTAEMQDALDRLRAWGQTKPGSPYNAESGIDAHDLRSDVAPRSVPVTDAERSDAIAMSIFAGWEMRLGRVVFDDDFAGTRIPPPDGEDVTKALLHILKDIDRTDPGFQVHTKGPNGESTFWDDQRTLQVETRDEIMLAALRDGLTFMAQKFQSPQPDNWLWGKIHQVRFQHFLGLAGVPSFDLGPFAAPGARFTVNPADFDLHSDDFTFSSGPSERFVAVLDPAGIQAVNIVPGGENGNPGGHIAENYNRINPDLHYGEFVPGWINGETFTYHSTPADVAAHARRKIDFTP